MDEMDDADEAVLEGEADMADMADAAVAETVTTKMAENICVAWQALNSVQITDKIKYEAIGN